MKHYLTCIFLVTLAVALSLTVTNTAQDPGQHQSGDELDSDIASQLTGTSAEVDPGQDTKKSEGGKETSDTTTDSRSSKNTTEIEPRDVPTQKRYVNEYDAALPQWKPENEHPPRESNFPIVEVTRYPNTEPSSEHYQASWEFYSEAYEAAEEQDWFNFEKGISDGYRRYDKTHYINKEYYFDGEELNPNKPEALIYKKDPSDGSSKVLAGIMYMVDSIEGEGEQVGGPLTVWHYHPRSSKDCLAGRLAQGRNFNTDCSESDIKKYRSTEMIHIWFARNPKGPFASDMIMPNKYLKRTDKIPEEEFKNYTREKYEEFRNTSKNK